MLIYSLMFQSTRPRRARPELAERYSRLESDHRQLVERQTAIAEKQQRIIEAQSETTDRIGIGIVKLEERAGSIETEVSGISDDNRAAQGFLQQLLNYYIQTGIYNSPSGD